MAHANAAGNQLAKSGLMRFPMLPTASTASPSSSASRRSMPERSDAAILGTVATSIVLIDQLTKFLLVSSIGLGRLPSQVEIVDGWLALEYTENRGAAFGLLSGLA